MHNTSNDHNVLRNENKTVSESLFPIQKSKLTFLSSLSILVKPIIDRFGSQIQILKLKNYGMIGHITETQGNEILISKNKINSPLCPGVTPDDLLKRIESVVGATWDLVYKADSGEIIIIPHLIAAGKFRTVPIRHGKESPVSHLNRDQLRAMYVAKGYTLLKHHVSNTSDHEVYTNGRHMSVIDYKNEDNEPPHIDVYRNHKHQFFRDYPPHKDYPAKHHKKQLKTRFAIKSDDDCTNKSPTEKTPGIKQFHENLQKTGLTKSYNSTHRDHPAPSKGGTSGDIGGVGSIGDYINGLFGTNEALFEDTHCFFIPTTKGEEIPFSESEFHQILHELTRGIYLHNTVPFFSLHFNSNGHLYPVIHPVYEKTLVGQVFGMLDYMMKGYLNGGVFKEEFVKEWANRIPRAKIEPTEAILDQLINFELYTEEHIKTVQSPYISLRNFLSMVDTSSDFSELFFKKLNNLIEKLAKIDLREDAILSDYLQFNNSFRIIAYQNKIQKNDNLFILDSDFKVEYTIDPSPKYKTALERYRKVNGEDPKSYKILEQVYRLIAERVHDHFTKFPLTRKYFSLLKIINFLSMYLSTLKKHGKFPILTHSEKRPYFSPSLFPALPMITTDNYQISIDMQEIVSKLISKFRVQLEKVFLDNTYNISFKREVEKTLFEFTQTEILNGVKPEVKRKFLREPKFLKKISKKILSNLDFFKLSIDRYTQFLEFSNKGVPDWLSNKLNVNYPKIFLDQYLHTNFKKIEFSIPLSVFVLPSEISPLQNLAKRGVVGGCGMQMIPLDVEESGHASGILDFVIPSILKTPSGRFIPINENDPSLPTGFAINLLFEDMPPGVDGEIQEMQKLFTVLDPDIAPAQKQVIKVLKKLSKGDKAGFVKEIEDENLHLLVDGEGLGLLHHAVMHVDIFYIEELLKRGFPTELVDQNGYTILHYAAMYGHIDHIKLILETNKHLLDKANSQGATPLIVAIQNRQLRLVGYLLDQGAKINTKLRDGYTILHTSAHTGDVDIFKLVMQKMVSVLNKDGLLKLLDSKTEAGITPLMVASNGDVEVVKMLVAAGASVRKKSKKGETALDLAIKNRQVEICSFLVPLSRLSSYTVERAIRKCSLEINQNLAKKTSYHLSFNAIHDTPLILAIRYAHIQFALYLITITPTIALLERKNKMGESAIKLAAKNGFFEIVESLINRHVAIDRFELLENILKAGYEGDSDIIQTYIHETNYTQEDLQKLLLVTASAANHVAITKVLVPIGADLDQFRAQGGWRIEHYLARSDGIFLFRKRFNSHNHPLMPLDQEGGKSVHYIAAENNSLRILAYLLDHAITHHIPLHQHFMDKHLLWPICENGNIEALSLFLNKVKIDGILNISLDSSGKRAVHIAAENGHLKIVEFLYANGAEFSILDKFGNSPLYYAVKSKNKELIELLLKTRRQQIISSETIYLASSFKKDTILKMLIFNGGSIQQPSNQDGMPPLMIAIQRNDYRAFSKLVAHHADLKFVTPEGLTPFLLAIIQQNLPLMRKIIALLSSLDKEQHYKGDSALHLAVKSGNGECIQFLLEHGFSPLKRNQEGKTAIDLAEGFEAKAAFEGTPERTRYLNLNRTLYEALKYENLSVLKKNIDRWPVNTYFSYTTEKMSYRGTIVHLLLMFGKNIADCEFLVQELCKKSGFIPHLKNESGESYGHLMVLAEIDPTQFPNVSLKEKNNRGFTPLHIAASMDNEVILKNLISNINTEEINAVDHSGKTPLYHAIINKQRSNIELLLINGAIVNHVDNKKLTPLATACAFKQFPTIRRLVEHGAEVNPRNKNQCISPLKIALKFKLEEISLYLLSSGIQITNNLDNGTNFVHLAAGTGRLSIMRLLAARGLEINTYEQGLQPIHIAAKKGEIKIVEELIAQGISIETPRYLEAKDKNPKHQKKIPLLVEAARYATVDTIRWLLSHGANPDNDDCEALNVLRMAMQNDEHNCEEIIKLLKEYRLIDDIQNLIPAIVAALSKDYVGPLKLLHQMGISIDTDLGMGCTMLHYASLCGALHCTHFLLRNGADAFKLNVQGNSAFELAAGNKNADQFKLLLRAVDYPIDQRYQRGETLIHIAASKGNLQHIAMLIDLGADFDLQDVMGKTPLFIGAESGYFHVVELLLFCGANSEIGTTFNNARPIDVANPQIRALFDQFEIKRQQMASDSTVLHMAARNAPVLIVNLLIRHFDVNAKNALGSTPLHEAVKGEKMANIRALLKEEAEVDAENQSGITPLEVACLELKNREIAKLLLKAGARSDHIDHSGKTILDKLRIDPHGSAIMDLFQN